MSLKRAEHTAALHAEVRSDIVLWMSLPLVGFQQPAEPCNPDDVVELRTCTCGSTLGRKTRRLSMRFEVYRDKAGEHRWRLLFANGKIAADSGEGYTRREDAHRAIATILKDLCDVVIVDA